MMYDSNGRFKLINTCMTTIIFKMLVVTLFIKKEKFNQNNGVDLFFQHNFSWYIFCENFKHNGPVAFQLVLTSTRTMWTYILTNFFHSKFFGFRGPLNGYFRSISTLICYDDSDLSKHRESEWAWPSIIETRKLQDRFN